VIEEAFTNSFQESEFLLDEPTVVKRNAHADTAAANKGGFGFLTMPTCKPPPIKFRRNSIPYFSFIITIQKKYGGHSALPLILILDGSHPRWLSKIAEFQQDHLHRQMLQQLVNQVPTIIQFILTRLQCK
jgi:hypothetical protein